MRNFQKIIIASDSFKGSLTSLEVAEAAEAGILSILPDCEVVKIPIADGGEGMVEAIISITEGSLITCNVHDPLMRPIEASYGITGDKQTAVIEMASACGLPLLAQEERNPALTSTFGLGEMILDALHKGCKKFVIGIGGSATNDAGVGMLQALGYIFRDRCGKVLGHGGRILDLIESIDSSHATELLTNVNFSVACDVNNPFCGKFGAAYVFAPQKGADEAMIELLDIGMHHFTQVLTKAGYPDITDLPGTGAAGGLGGGFFAFLKGHLSPGIDLILQTIGFEERIAGADLIITGEGRMDNQTLMGKAPFGVLKMGIKHAIPVIGIAGSVEDVANLCEAGFGAVLPILPSPVSLAQAMEKEFTQKNISRTVSQLIRLINL